MRASVLVLQMTNSQHETRNQQKCQVQFLPYPPTKLTFMSNFNTPTSQGHPAITI